MMRVTFPCISRDKKIFRCGSSNGKFDLFSDVVSNCDRPAFLLNLGLVLSCSAGGGGYLLFSRLGYSPPPGQDEGVSPCPDR